MEWRIFRPKPTKDQAQRALQAQMVEAAANRIVSLYENGESAQLAAERDVLRLRVRVLLRMCGDTGIGQ